MNRSAAPLSVLHVTSLPAALKPTAPGFPTRPGLSVLPAESGDEAGEMIGRADLIILQRAGLDAALLRAAGQCRAVIHAGPGCETDLETARELGIYVCSIADAATGTYRATAGRIMREFLAAWHGGRTATRPGGLRRRARVGLVGFGRLGRAFAEEARTLKLDVWGHDPFALEEPFKSMEVHRTAMLHDLLGIADLVLVQVASARSNAGMIGADALAWMKRGAWLANFGWEAAVEVKALAGAVASGRLGRAMVATPGAAIDRVAGELGQGIEPFDPVMGVEAAVHAEELRRALDLAQSIERGEEPSPLLIDPPLPRWGS